MKTEANGFLEKHLEYSRKLKCPCEERNAEQITEKMRIYSLESYTPPKRMEDPGFGKSNGHHLDGGVYWPNGGYVTDPALSSQNLAEAARKYGAEFRLGVEVVDILKADRKVRGVKLADGEEIHAPIVINVAGPVSSHINAMAGVLDEMTIETRPLRQEVVHVLSPEGFYSRKRKINEESSFSVLG